MSNFSLHRVHFIISNSTGVRFVWMECWLLTAYARRKVLRIFYQIRDVFLVSLHTYLEKKERNRQLEICCTNI